MVIIREATYTTRCMFSRKLIKPNNRICLFNKQQYEAFENIIYGVLDSRLPTELIDLVIQSTNYKKYIGRFGHEKVTHWSAPTTQSGRETQLSLKSKKVNKFNNYAQYDDTISSSDSEDDSD